MSTGMDSSLKGQTPDRSILTNIVFCLVVGIPLFLAFCLLKKVFKEVYTPNILNAKK